MLTIFFFWAQFLVADTNKKTILNNFLNLSEEIVTSKPKNRKKVSKSAKESKISNGINNLPQDNISQKSKRYKRQPLEIADPAPALDNIPENELPPKSKNQSAEFDPAPETDQIVSGNGF